MSITTREAMILSLVLPDDAYQSLTPDQIDALAGQFGVDPLRVKQLASRFFSQIREAGLQLRQERLGNWNGT